MSDEKKAKAAALAKPKSPASKPAAIEAEPQVTEAPKAEAPKAEKPKAAPKPKAAKAAKIAKPVKPAAPAVAAAEPEAPKGDKKDARPKKEKKEKKKAKKKEKRKKEAVIIRFEDAQLPQIDARAEALGLSRAAWVRMVVAQALVKG